MGKPVKFQSNKVFFPHLDAIRALAILMVFFEHIGLISTRVFNTSLQFSYFKITYLYRGYMGVSLFFVLSGFLISYLLLSEKRDTGKINLPYFYMRRILRIWPLYFTILFVGFVLVPAYAPHLADSGDKPWYYLFFLANFNMMEAGVTSNKIILPMWSISVEEQFYILFPLLTAWLAPKKLPWAMFALIAGSVIFRALGQLDYVAMDVHSLVVMGDLALGVLLGYGIFYSDKFRKFFEKMPRLLILAVYITGIYLLMNASFDFNPPTVIFSRLCYVLFFGFIIMEQNFAEKSIVKLSKIKGLDYLGKISFGVYCLHQPAQLICTWLAEKWSDTWTGQFLIIATGGLCLSIIFASLSYRYFETPLLKLKRHFTIIKNREV